MTTEIDKAKKALSNLKGNLLKDILNKILAAGSKQKFIDTVPEFEEDIIAGNNMYIPGEFNSNSWQQFSRKYRGERYLPFGINRSKFDSSTTRSITNFKDEHSIVLFVIELNMFSIFGNDCDWYHGSRTLFDTMDKLSSDIFFFDESNHRVYVADENVVTVIDSLLDWIEEERKEQRKIINKNKAETLRKQLEALEKE